MHLARSVLNWCKSWRYGDDGWYGIIFAIDALEKQRRTNENVLVGFENE